MSEPVSIPADLDITPLVTDRPWIAEARCAGLGRAADATFFGDEGSGKDDLIDHGRALRFCSQCPTRRPCLEEALTAETGRRDPATGRWMRKLPVGVFGGCSVEMRHRWEIRHVEGCDCGNGKFANVPPGCRPMGDVLDLLEAYHRIEARKYLCDDEQVLE